MQIAGATFRLNEDAREASGVGTRLSAGAAYAPVVGRGLRGHLALSTAAKLYERSAGTTSRSSARPGSRGFSMRQRVRRHAGRAPLAGHGGVPAQHRVWASVDYRLSPRTRIGANAAVDHRSHRATG